MNAEGSGGLLPSVEDCVNSTGLGVMLMPLGFVVVVVVVVVTFAVCSFQRT